jgi:hypothetical protein
MHIKSHVYEIWGFHGVESVDYGRLSCDAL